MTTTYGTWVAPGSNKDLGFFAVGPSSTSSIILCESAIDAISCSQLHPQSRCLSAAGARAKPRWLSNFISQGLKIYCGYDADQVGDAMSHAMQTRYPEVKRLRPPRKDWNDVLKSAPRS